MKLTPEETRVKTTQEFLTHFCTYLRNVQFEQIIFSCPVNEALILFSFQSVCEKVFKQFFRYMNRDRRTHVNLKFNHAERITMSIIFKHFDTPPEISDIEFQILDRLLIAG